MNDTTSKLSLILSHDNAINDFCLPTSFIILHDNGR